MGETDEEARQAVPGRPPDPSPDGSAQGGPVRDGDAEIDLSDVSWVDSVALVLFWILAGVVFLQFFTRYVLNDSIGWTEEIARYLLIGTAFSGAVLAVRKNTHIYVEFFYRYLPPAAGRVLSTLVDLGRIAFFATIAWIAAKLADRTNQKMASVELSKSVVYWVVFVAFVAMTLYAVRVAWHHWKTGHSPLTRPAEPKIMD